MIRVFSATLLPRTNCNYLAIRLLHLSLEAFTFGQLARARSGNYGDRLALKFSASSSFLVGLGSLGFTELQLTD